MISSFATLRMTNRRVVPSRRKGASALIFEESSFFFGLLAFGIRCFSYAQQDTWRLKKLSLQPVQIGAGEDLQCTLIHTVHSGTRNLVEATKFVGQIKANSDEKAPLLASDDWFYEQALLAHYGFEYTPAYAGRGRRPLPKRLPLPDLNYVQVQKKRDEKGRLLEIKYCIEPRQWLKISLINP